MTRPPPPSFPRLPAELPRLEGPAGPLARAAPASSLPFSLTGRRARAHGTGLRGLEALRAGPWLLADLRTGLGLASGIVVGPSSVRREAIGGGGTVLETVLVPAAVAGAALQWSRPAGAEAPLSLDLEWTVAREGADLLTHGSSGDRSWIVPPRASQEGVDRSRGRGDEAPDAAGPLALMLVRPAPVSWEARADGPTLRMSARVEARTGEAVTLLFAAGRSEAEAGAALRAAANLRAQERRLDQATSDAREEGLALHTAVEELDEALEWAKARLRGAVSEEEGRRRIRRGGAACPEASAATAAVAAGDAAAGDAFAGDAPADGETLAAWTALGGLAAGEPEPARVLLEDAPPSPHLLWVLARYVLWTGDGRPLLARLDGIREWLGSGEAVDTTLARIAALELADACEGLGEQAMAEALRARRPAAGAVRRLPMVGGAPAPAADDPDALVAALAAPLDAESYAPPAAAPVTSVSRALRAWALCRAGDPEAGYLLLREHLGAGLARGAGTWPELVGGGGCGDHTASAALGPAALLFGLLGARADAAVGRLHLAPRLPTSWASFAVSGVRVGDAAVSLRYARAGDGHVFTARQRAGRVPIMLILEPQIVGEVGGVLVDGATAELDRFRRSGRTGVRIQLPLERERTVTLLPTDAGG